MVDSQSGKRLIYYASKKQQVNWDMGVQWDGIVECMDFDALLALPKNNPERSPDGIVIAFNDEAEMTEDSGSKLAELRDYCQLRYIPVVVIAEQNMLELKRTLLPEALLHPSEKVELQLYIHKLLKQRESIISQLLIDPVTGLYNSRYLHKEVQTLLDDMKRAFEPFTLIYVHRDNKLTDHLINMITHAIRPTDRVALHAKGGLVIVLPRTSRDDAHKLLNRLNEQIALSAHVREFSDATLSVEQCLDIVTLTDDSYHHEHKGVRRLKIAIIDDDRLIREMLIHQLADIGEDQFDIEVRAYADGELFFDDDWHRQNEQYVVLIDRVMPKMEGLEVLRRIRANYARQSYHCIMISSRGSDSDIARCIQDGANDYVVKPFSLNELRARINRIIGVKK